MLFWALSDSFHLVFLILSFPFIHTGELKLRLSGMAAQNRNMKIPSPTYVGMFAGATKPKPFQRKRPNISHLPSAKLPTLHDMRSSAIDLHKGGLIFPFIQSFLWFLLFFSFFLHRFLPSMSWGSFETSCHCFATYLWRFVHRLFARFMVVLVPCSFLITCYWFSSSSSFTQATTPLPC